MAISETKMQIVIANYFKDECDVNTSIRQAFEKGFRIGVKKGASTNGPQEWIPCSERLPSGEDAVLVSTCAFDAIYDVVFMMAKDVEYFYECGHVNAWMPSPKPYEKVKENE